jgi:hypothetical protein
MFVCSACYLFVFFPGYIYDNKKIIVTIAKKEVRFANLKRIWIINIYHIIFLEFDNGIRITLTRITRPNYIVILKEMIKIAKKNGAKFTIDVDVERLIKDK